MATMNKDGTPRKRGSGRTKGSVSFVETTLGELNNALKPLGKDATILVGRKWVEGLEVVGIDSDPNKSDNQRHIYYGDIEDVGFWHQLDIRGLSAVTLATPELESKLIASRELRKAGFTGQLIAGIHFQDEAEPLHSAGVDQTYLLMTGAGIGIAEKTWEKLQEASQ